MAKEKKNNYIQKFIIIILFGLFSCQSQDEKTISLICNNDFKYWIYPSWDSEYKVFTKSYMRFGKDGSFGYYHFNQKGLLVPSEEPQGLLSNDIIYPNHWELKNKSTIVYKIDHSIMYECKIDYLTKDIMVIPHSVRDIVVKDTLYALCSK